jgi:glycosyltransferase involved in cell wall biosynthesis
VIVPSWKFRYEYEKVNNVHIHKVRSINFEWVHPEACFTFLPARQIKRIFEQFRPDVVHIQDHYFLCRDVALVALRMKIPLMGTNHFLPENVLPYLKVLPLPRRFKISIMWGLQLWTYNRLQVITTPTETAAQILSGQKVRVPITPVSCGIDTSFFHPNVTLDRVAACVRLGLDPDKVLFFYVGRLDSEKRIDLLLRALTRLKGTSRNEIQLAIAGRGAAGGNLRALAHSLNLDNQVKFLGYVSNQVLPLLYQVGHIFAMPSPEELQSIATLEAMASGRPILAANARALPELVTHKENGYLFESGNVDAVVEGMAYLIDHRADWERMGIASRSRAVAHSLENTIRRYEEIYLLLSGKSLEAMVGEIEPKIEPVKIK